jgi:hypothetical protein
MSGPMFLPPINASAYNSAPRYRRVSLAIACYTRAEPLLHATQLSGSSTAGARFRNPTCSSRRPSSAPSSEQSGGSRPRTPPRPNPDTPGGAAAASHRGDGRPVRHSGPAPLRPRRPPAVSRRLPAGAAGASGLEHAACRASLGSTRKRSGVSGPCNLWALVIECKRRCCNDLAPYRTDSARYGTDTISGPRSLSVRARASLQVRAMARLVGPFGPPFAVDIELRHPRTFTPAGDTSAGSPCRLG